jgi:hypothetical protein
LYATYKKTDNDKISNTKTPANDCFDTKKPSHKSNTGMDLSVQTNLYIKPVLSSLLFPL